MTLKACLKRQIVGKDFKNVFRGDHTHVDFLIAVVPPNTPAVVFSIDGSFAASMSVTGKDPKVRPGCVDICR